jgi:polar amino acid transport system substrate-binding protein
MRLMILPQAARPVINSFLLSVISCPTKEGIMGIKKWLGCAAASSLLLAAGAQASQLDQIKAAGVIKVATSLSVKPYTYTDASMQPTGADVETARLLAKDLGVKLEIVGTTVAARIPTLLSGKADVVISVLVKTPEREKVVDFSLPYSFNENVIVAPAALKLGSYDDLAGKTIGVPRGTIEDQMVTQIAKKSTIRRYEDVPTLITAVIAGQIQISAGSLTMLGELNKSGHTAYERKFTLHESEVGIGLRKHNPELRAWLDQWVKTNLANGKLNAIYKKYLGADLPSAMTAGK